MHAMISISLFFISLQIQLQREVFAIQLTNTDIFESRKNVLTELKKKSQYDIMSGTFNGISEDKSTNKYKKWLQ